jgi:hypothetical protein
MPPPNFKGMALWIDDMRDPVMVLRPKFVEMFPEFRAYTDAGWKPQDFMWCKTAYEAIERVKFFGVPQFVALDHDLGTHDIFVFLKWYFTEHMLFPPDWHCHSANPDGVKNINSYMQSWHKTWGKDRE